MARTISYVLGAVLVVIGLWGFVENPVLGLFAANMLHSLVHILTGAILLWVAYQWNNTSMLVLKIFGVVYAALAVIGFVMGGTMLFGLIDNSHHDQVLHLVLGAILLWAGFMGGEKSEMSSAPMSNPM